MMILSPMNPTQMTGAVMGNKENQDKCHHAVMKHLND